MPLAAKKHFLFSILLKNCKKKIKFHAGSKERSFETAPKIMEKRWVIPQSIKKAKSGAEKRRFKDKRFSVQRSRKME
ncbi:MAG: hypothetical protein IPK21_23180 [Haliscomenobacter sp.]|nr:hypothetical protein [Haliscomenobacter sp.]